MHIQSCTLCVLVLIHHTSTLIIYIRMIYTHTAVGDHVKEDEVLAEIETDKVRLITVCL